MAITAALTLSQGADKTKFTVADSTPYGGGEPRSSFTGRTITVYKSDGTVLGTYDFSYAAYPSDQIEVTGLDKDLSVTVNMAITPGSVVSGSVYTAQAIKTLTGYSMGYFFDRMKNVSAQPRLELNNSFMLDTYKILMFSDAAVQAGLDSDTESAQLSLDRARNIELYNPKPY